jgi:hypothetical protein
MQTLRVLQAFAAPLHVRSALKNITSFAFCLSYMPHRLVDLEIVILRELKSVFVIDRRTILIASLSTSSSRISVGIWFAILPPFGGVPGIRVNLEGIYFGRLGRRLQYYLQTVVPQLSSARLRL